MSESFDGVTVYFEPFQPPLTIEKVFGSLHGLENQEIHAQYTAFLEYVLSQVDSDTDPSAEIEGFDVREGTPRLIFPTNLDFKKPVEAAAPTTESQRIEQLKYENDSLKDMNKRLHIVREKDRKDNQSFWWAMFALLGLIVAGYFGFGDY